MLNSRQRAQLKGLASKEDTIFQIGKGGVSDELIHQLSNALKARELIKIKVLETSPGSAREIAGEIAGLTESEVVQVIGFKFVLYKQSPEKLIKLVK